MCLLLTSNTPSLALHPRRALARLRRALVSAGVGRMATVGGS